MFDRKSITILLLVGIIVFLVIKLFPFYQRYWASCLDQVGGGCKGGGGDKFVEDLKTVAYKSTFDEAGQIARELDRTPTGPAREGEEFKQFTVKRTSMIQY